MIRHTKESKMANPKKEERSPVPHQQDEDRDETEEIKKLKERN
jgi:hypothetical protein